MRTAQRVSQRLPAILVATIVLLVGWCGTVSSAAIQQIPWEFFGAASEGNIPKLERFLLAGVGINAREAEGETALMYAANRGRSKAVLYLIKRGADVNLLSENNETAPARAALMGRTRAVEILLEHGALIDESIDSGGSPLAYAAMGGYLNTVAHADVNLRTDTGRTAVM